MANKDTLGVYLSQTTTTKRAAILIADILKARLAELTPVNPYPEGFFGLDATVQQEIAEDHYPSYSPLDIDFTKYSAIYIGYPTWYHQAPNIVQNFLNNAELSGKTIIPFTTSSANSIDVSSAGLSRLATQIGFNLKHGFTANSLPEIYNVLKNKLVG